LSMSRRRMQAFPRGRHRDRDRRHRCMSSRRTAPRASARCKIRARRVGTGCTDRPASSPWHAPANPGKSMLHKGFPSSTRSRTNLDPRDGTSWVHRIRTPRPAPDRVRWTQSTITESTPQEPGKKSEKFPSETRTGPLRRRSRPVDDHPPAERPVDGMI